MSFWVLLSTLWYLWVLLSTFGYYRVLFGIFGAFGYFWVFWGIFGNFWVLCGTFECFWVLLIFFCTFGTLGYFQVLLSTFQVRNLSGNVRKWSGNVNKLPEIIRIFSKIDNITKNTFCIRPAWAPKARRLAAKKANAQPSSPLLWFNFFLCSFLFFLFKSFHMARQTGCSIWVTVLYPHLWWSCLLLKLALIHYKNDQIALFPLSLPSSAPI